MVPAYFHPALAAADWAGWPGRGRAAAGRAQRGQRPRRVPDHAFFDVVRDVQSGGAPVRRVTSTPTTAQARVGQVLAELHRYWEWYGVRDVFLDRAASGIEYVDRTGGSPRSAGRSAPTVVAFNHGTHPAPEYAEHADLLGTFEGPLPAFLDLDVPRWVHDRPADWFYHLLLQYTGDVAGRSRHWPAERNVGSLYRTERTRPNPWAGLPVDFPHAPTQRAGAGRRLPLIGSRSSLSPRAAQATPPANPRSGQRK